MLEFINVYFNYGGSGGINGVSFALRRGEFAVLMGENGAGKSTLCRLANGLLKPSSGRVSVCGNDTSRVRTSALARRAGFLFQNPDRQMCRNTVRDEIDMGLEYTVADPAARAERRDAMLELFSLDGERDPFCLSRGERQKVALASVLAPGPEILILDEPATGLDYRECVAIMDIIAELNATGTTVLMVSHDMEIAVDYARRALILSGGKLIGDGGVREMTRDKSVMGLASLLPAQIPSLAAMVSDLGADFAGAFSVEDMAGAVERARATRNPAL